MSESKPITHSKPKVAPTLDTALNIVLYVIYKYEAQTKEMNKLLEKLYKESLNPDGTSKYSCQLSKKHLEEVKQVCEFKISVEKETIDMLDGLMIKPKVKGQINLAKDYIKASKRIIEVYTNKQRYWCVPV